MFLLIIIWLESVELIYINNERHMLNTLRVSKDRIVSNHWKGGGCARHTFITLP